MGFVGEVQEEVGGGPQLWGRWGGQELERAGECPVERADGAGEQPEGLKLADSRDESSSSCGGAVLGDHIMKDSAECVGRRKGRLPGMAQREGSEVPEVGVGGAWCPRAYGGSQWVGIC